jgi:hypothetical protein
MNARQRRRDRKKWKYHVKLTYEQSDRNGYDRMFDWCRDTFGNGVVCAGWREKHRCIGTWWQFTSAEKAALFSLRWT